VFAFSWLLGTWMGSFLLLSIIFWQCTHQGGDWETKLICALVYIWWAIDQMIWGFVCVVLSSHFSYHFSGVLSTHSGWVVDNVVWTDSWLSIAGAGCGLTCVGAGEERVWKVLALRGLRGVERQVGSARWTWWPNGIRCGPHGGKKSKTKSWTGVGAR
jgi:hypothetical protein